MYVLHLLYTYNALCSYSVEDGGLLVDRDQRIVFAGLYMVIKQIIWTIGTNTNEHTGSNERTNERTHERTKKENLQVIKQTNK